MTIFTLIMKTALRLGGGGGGGGGLLRPYYPVVMGSVFSAESVTVTLELLVGLFRTY